MNWLVRANQPKFEFGTHSHQARGVCGVMVATRDDGRKLVVFTERADNPGRSITNAVEFLAREVCRSWGFDHTEVYWIEHYPVGTSGARPARGHVDHRVETEGTWDRVMFTPRSMSAIFSPTLNPMWRWMKEEDFAELGLTPAELAALVGEKR